MEQIKNNYENMNKSVNVNIDNMSVEEKFFGTNYGYDTKKMINRSNKIVPREILEEIEKGITLERLKSIDLPIYVYPTQITIHGQFDTLTQQYIGRYKLIFQNKNKSIGIKWTAIDYEKKKTIYTVLKHLGYSIVQNSSKYYAIKTIPYDVKIYGKIKEEYERIDMNMLMAIGNKSMFVGNIPYIGKFYVIKIDIQAIPQENVWTFLEKSFGMTKERWEEIQQQKEKEIEEKRRRDEIEFQKYKEEREKRIKETNKEYMSKYKVIQTFEDIPDNDCILLYLDKYQYEYLIKKYTDKNKRIYFQHMRHNLYDMKLGGVENINTKLRKYIREENFIKKIFDNYTVFLVKEF